MSNTQLRPWQEKAIKKSTELLDREDFENYKIIDLRVEGTIIVE